MDLSNNKQGADQESGKPTIKLNRKMRFWNKYKTYMIGATCIVIVLGAGVFVLKNYSNNTSDNQVTTTVTANQNANTIADAEDATQATTQAVQQTTTEATTQATTQTTGIYKISGTAEATDYTSADFFANSMFLGDSVMEGISYYGYLPSTQVIYNGNMTTDKAKDYVSSVISANPSKVFIMVGLNDINYGSRDAEEIASLYADLVSSIKSGLPNAQIYILSVLPVTQTFESKSTNVITQSAIDSLNAALSEKASSMGASYIDVSSAFKDSSGYMNASFTGNGSNIYNEYYPFLLNGIAGVLK